MPKKDASVNQITEGVIWKQLLIFFFPIMLGTLFQQLYNTADAVVVGRFVGTKALAAVGGSTGQITNLIVNFFVALASGATVIIARYYGAKNKKDLNDTLHTAAALSIVGGILTTIAGIALAPVLLEMMKTPADVMPDSVTYLRIYFAGIIFVFIYNVGSAILRAVGDSTRPLYFLIVCCFINIFLDILLVVGFNMGVAGAAIATVISQVVSAILIIHALIKSTDMYRLEPKKIRFHKFLLVSIITIGLPAGIQSIMYNISNIIIQTSLNDLGTDTMAAYTAFGKIDAIYWMISGAFSVSIITFIGQNYGAGKYDRMKKSVKVCLLLDFIASLLVSALLLFLGQYLLQLFTTDPEVIRIGMEIIRIIAPSYVLFIFIEILSSALRGMGNVLVPMIMTCTGVCILRILWIFLAVPHWPGVQSILMSYPISWGLTAVLFIVYYYFDQKKFYKTHQ
ncbi:MAG TPA: MATE family efflux transporter [Candidatus Blautia pullistercoris]|uniref:MATE family efflux transporter n=2 Tax=Blautia TaxID=572511 RepID=A0A9D1VLL4_9FIRM|nr:MATE family efflux transporter [Clostridiales bacterium]HIX37681.1 MATE family efflux transporter [Candidatus Blautia pullistercoris]